MTLLNSRTPSQQPQKAGPNSTPEQAEKKAPEQPLTQISKQPLKQTKTQTGLKRISRRRNRRQGFKPRRRGRPARTISGGSH